MLSMYSPLDSSAAFIEPKAEILSCSDRSSKFHSSHHSTGHIEQDYVDDREDDAFISKTDLMHVSHEKQISGNNMDKMTGWQPAETVARRITRQLMDMSQAGQSIRKALQEAPPLSYSQSREATTRNRMANQSGSNSGSKNHTKKQQRLKWKNYTTQRIQELIEGKLGRKEKLQEIANSKSILRALGRLPQSLRPHASQSFSASTSTPSLGSQQEVATSHRQIRLSASAIASSGSGISTQGTPPRLLIPPHTGTSNHPSTATTHTKSSAADPQTLQSKPENGITGISRIAEFREKRRVRHEEAVHGFYDRTDQLHKILADEVQEKCINIKNTLAKSDSVIQQVFDRLPDDKIMNSVAADINKIWEDVMEELSHRQQYISEFSASLDAVEDKRMRLFEQELHILIRKLISIGHVSEATIQKSLLEDVQKLNVQVIRNRNAALEAVTQLSIKEEESKYKYEQRWKERQATWRQLRYEREFQQLLHDLKQPDFVDPPLRRETIKNVQAYQGKIYEEVLQNLEKLLSFNLQSFTLNELNTEFQRILSLRTASDDAAVKCIQDLKQQKEDIQAKERAVIEQRKAALVCIELKPAHQIETEFEQQIYPFLTKRHDDAIKLINEIDTCLQWNDSSVYRKIENVARFVVECAQYIIVLSQNITKLHSDVAEGLNFAVDQYLDQQTSFAKILFQSLQRLRSAPDLQSLTSMSEETRKIAGAGGLMEDMHRKFYSENVESARSHETKLVSLLEEFRFKIAAQFSLLNPANNTNLASSAMASTGSTLPQQPDMLRVTSSSSTTSSSGKQAAVRKATEKTKKVEPARNTNQPPATTSQQPQQPAPDTEKPKSCVKLFGFEYIEAATIEELIEKITSKVTEEDGLGGTTPDDFVATLQQSANSTSVANSTPEQPANEFLAPTTPKTTAPNRKIINLNSTKDSSVPLNNFSAASSVKQTGQPTVLEVSSSTVSHGDTKEGDQPLAKPEVPPTCPTDESGSPWLSMREIDRPALLKAIPDLRDRLLLHMNYVHDQQLEFVRKLCKEREDELSTDLDYQLRVHRPKMARIESEVLEPRKNELIDNKKRFSRYVERIHKLLNQGNSSFSNDYAECVKKLEEFKTRSREMSTRIQDPNQIDMNSLASIQKDIKGSLIALEVSYKHHYEELKNIIEDVQAQYQQVKDQFVQSCLDQQIKQSDWVATYQIQLHGGNDQHDSSHLDSNSALVQQTGMYHPDEIKYYKKLTDELDTLLEEMKQKTTKLISELESKMEAIRGNGAESLVSQYEKIFKAAHEDLSIKLGVGQKYGAPKRYLTTSLRTIFARDENSHIAVETKIQRLISTVSNSLSQKDTFSPVSLEQSLAVNTVKEFDEIRKIMFKRAVFLQCILEGSAKAISLREITYVPIIQAERQSQEEVPRQRLPELRENRKSNKGKVPGVGGVDTKSQAANSSEPKSQSSTNPPEKMFLEEVSEAENQCKIQMTELIQAYQVSMALAETQEKKTTEKRATSGQGKEVKSRTRSSMSTNIQIPQAILDHCASELSRAKAHLEESVELLRNQEETFFVAWPVIAEAVMNDIQEHVLAKIRGSLNSTEETFTHLYEDLHSKRELHKSLLKPTLLRSGKAALDDLCEKEQQRAQSSKTAIVQSQEKRLTALRENAQEFVTKMLHFSKLLVELFDNSLMPTDLKAPPGGFPPSRHKNIKRLLRIKQRAALSRNNQIEDAKDKPSTKEKAKSRPSPPPSATQSTDADISAIRKDPKVTWPGVLLAEFDVKVPGSAEPQKIAPVVEEQKAAKPSKSATAAPNTKSVKKEETEKREAIEPASPQVSESLTGLRIPGNKALIKARDNVCREVKRYLQDTLGRIVAETNTLVDEEAKFQRFWESTVASIRANL